MLLQLALVDTIYAAFSIDQIGLTGLDLAPSWTALHCTALHCTALLPERRKARSVLFPVPTMNRKSPAGNV